MFEAIGTHIPSFGVGLVLLFLSVSADKEIIKQLDQFNSSRTCYKLKLQDEVVNVNIANETDTENYWHHRDTIRRFFTKRKHLPSENT